MLYKIFAISLNVLFPGVGTLFMGKIVQGIVQLLLEFIGLMCVITGIFAIIGLLIWVAVWVWALVVGIQWASAGGSSVKVRAL